MNKEPSRLCRYGWDEPLPAKRNAWRNLLKHLVLQDKLHKEALPGCEQVTAKGSKSVAATNMMRSGQHSSICGVRFIQIGYIQENRQASVKRSITSALQARLH